MKNLTTVLLLLTLCKSVATDECNLLATISKIETFYLTQRYTKEVTIDLKEYIEAFPQLDRLTESFSQNLATYETDTSIETTEPLTLIPFTEDLNAYKVATEHVGKDAFKACMENKGSLIELTSENRAMVAQILKNQSMAKTPIHVMPFYSILSTHDKEVLDTPDDIDMVKGMWSRSPPMLDSDNRFVYPVTKKVGEANAETLTSHTDYKSQILCVKARNPWDLKTDRSSWYKLVPKLKAALGMLVKLKHSYDLSTKALKNIPKSSTKPKHLLRLALPEPFQEVLGFMDKLKDKKAWEKLKSDSRKKFYRFVQMASKLANTFNLSPNSLTKLEAHENPKFIPPSVIEINWRDHLELDAETYGISGPMTIKPQFAHSKEGDGTPTLYKALIDTRIFNRETDKITLYRVKSNVIKGETFDIKMIVETPKLKLAVTQEIEPSHCESPHTEVHRVCGKLPYQALSRSTTVELSKCANALFSRGFTTDFYSCPRTPVDYGLLIYRAECGLELEPTVIVNSDRPVLLDFYCDGEKTTSKNFTSFPSLIPTNCEIRVPDGSVVLPQFNHELVEENNVGKISILEMPQPEPATIIQILIISISSSLAAMVLTAVIFLIIWKCKRSAQRQPSIENMQIPPFIPVPNQPELRFLEYHD